MLTLVVLVSRSDRSKELEILVLRHELAVLRRRSGRLAFEPADRAVLAALSQALSRRTWTVFSVRPETLLRWHRQLVSRRWTYPHRKPGRPPLARPRRGLILRLARENPDWGYQRIAGELKRLGLAVSPTTVRKVLSAADVPPAPERGSQSWRSFLRQQAASTLSCDFFTVETLGLQRIYVLFFISGDAPTRVRRLHTQPRPRLGDAAGSEPPHAAGRAGAPLPTADPRPRPEGLRRKRRTRTRSRSAGCGRSVASDAGTSNESYACTSSTTTSIGHTVRSNSPRRTAATVTPPITRPRRPLSIDTTSSVD